MTHDEMVAIGSAWLVAEGCCVVVTELATSCRETPDAIGWRSGYYHTCSTLIEAKAERSDMLRERRKASRVWAANGGRGLGQRRYMLVPLDRLTPDEIDDSTLRPWLPSGWGLLAVAPRGIAPHTHHVVRWVRLALAGIEYGVWMLAASAEHDPGCEEVAFLLSAVRRMPAGSGVRCRVYRFAGPADVEPRATIAISGEEGNNG